MTRPNAEGGQAARAGATNSLARPEDVTSLVKLLGMSEAEQQAEQHTKELDAAYFEQHPTAKSYVRPFHTGELSALVLMPYAAAPSHVAVAQLPAGERARIFLWPHHDQGEGRRNVEAAAAQQCAQLVLEAVQ